MLLPSLVTAAAAHHWLAAHAGQRALARPLIVLVSSLARLATSLPAATHGVTRPVAALAGVRDSDVSAQGRRVFANWRRTARIVVDDATQPMCELLAAVLASLAASNAIAGGGDDESDDGDDGDAYDLVAFGEAATRVRALGADVPVVGRAHHVLLVNPRGGRAGARSGPRVGVDRWLATDSHDTASAFVSPLFPSRPGRPVTLSRHLARPPRVRTLCSVRPARADAAHVAVVSRWRDEPVVATPMLASTRARWRRAHTAIALSTVFAQLAEVEARSPAEIRT